jgi:hypothetical protein
MDFMIPFQRIKISLICKMNKALDYVSIKSEIGNYTNFITKPIALNLFVSKDVRKISSSFFKRIRKYYKPYN